MLHIINKSPYTSNALQECLRFAAGGDVILLIEDGVYNAAKHAEIAAALNANVKVYALKEDIGARGHAGKLTTGVTVTDYAGFVELTVLHRLVQSW